MIASETDQKRKPLESELTLVVWLDHWKNDDLTLTIQEIKQKVENPIRFKSFGIVRYENERFLVIENIHSRQTEFLLKFAILSRESYSKNCEKIKR